MNGRTILAVVIAAIVYFGIGAVWYGQLSAPWLAGIGKTLTQLQAENPGGTPYLVGFAAILVECVVLAMLVRRTGCTGWLNGAKLGAVLAVGIVGAQLALNYAFEARSVTLWLINAGYALVGLAIAGAIIGAMSSPKPA